MKPGGDEAARQDEVRPQRVHDQEVCFLPDLERAEARLLVHGSRAAFGRVREDVFGLQLQAGLLIVAPDALRQQAIRITSKTSFVLLSVPSAIGQPAARSAGISGMTPRFAAMPA